MKNHIAKLVQVQGILLNGSFWTSDRNNANVMIFRYSVNPRFNIQPFFVYDYIFQDTYLWIDGSDAQGPFPFTNWFSNANVQAPTQANANQDCIVARQREGGWNDGSCNQADINFVCYRKGTC